MMLVYTMMHHNMVCYIHAHSFYHIRLYVIVWDGLGWDGMGWYGMVLYCIVFSILLYSLFYSILFCSAT